MNIFRRILPFGTEIESPSNNNSEESQSLSAPLEAGSSSMHQPDPGAGTPQSSNQRGRASDDECVIEILSSDDERGDGCNSVNDIEAKKKSAASTTSGRTNISHAGISKTAEDAITKAVLSAVSELKPPSSPLESTKSLSVTTTDTSNDYDDEGDEGKENSAASSSSRIDSPSNATASKTETDAPSSLVELGNATDIKSKESSLESTTELQSVTTTDNSKVFSARKRRRKRAKDTAHAVLPSTLLSLASPNGNRTNNRHQGKGRNDPAHESKTTPVRFVSKRYSTPSSLFASKERNEENPFAFPSETMQTNDDTSELRDEKKSSIETNFPNPSSSDIGSFKTGKRPLPDDFTELNILQNKRQNTQDDSKYLDNDDTNKGDTSCDQQVINKQDKDVQQQSGKKKLADDPPSKMIPEFKLPAELAPFNNPGVCDYGVIRTSRLRNRKKKANEHGDVLYQNIQGQRRCRATKDGRKMAGEITSNRCLNCAEGVFKYCHKHRDLDDDQRAFWVQRQRRDNGIRSVSSSINAKIETKAKPQNTASLKIKREDASQSQVKCLEVRSKGIHSTEDDDENNWLMNDVRQCVFLVPGKGRCNRKMLLTKQGFCNGHASSAPAIQTKKGEPYKPRSRYRTTRCTAVSKVGTKCKFKAVESCVFCARHIGAPPEKVSPVVLEGKVKKETILQKKGKDDFEGEDSTDGAESLEGMNHSNLSSL
jgi:hypothetical protein